MSAHSVERSHGVLTLSPAIIQGLVEVPLSSACLVSGAVHIGIDFFTLFLGSSTFHTEATRGVISPSAALEAATSAPPSLGSASPPFWASTSSSPSSFDINGTVVVSCKSLPLRAPEVVCFDIIKHTKSPPHALTPKRNSPARPKESSENIRSPFAATPPKNDQSGPKMKYEYNENTKVSRLLSNETKQTQEREKIPDLVLVRMSTYLPQFQNSTPIGR